MVIFFCSAGGKVQKFIVGEGDVSHDQGVGFLHFVLLVGPNRDPPILPPNFRVGSGVFHFGFPFGLAFGLLRFLGRVVVGCCAVPWCVWCGAPFPPSWLFSC